MAAPLKSSIVSAFKSWVEFKSIDYALEFELNDSAQVKKIKLEGLYEELKNEVRAQEAIITDVRNCLTAWGDLLRKMGGEERKAGNEEYTEFNNIHHVEDTLGVFEKNARLLREHTQKVGLQLKILKHEAEKEKQQEDIKYSAALASVGNQNGAGASSGARSLHSLYQLPTLQIRKFSGNRREWLDFYESFKCAIDNSVASEIEKLTLLRSLLEGEARELVSGFRLETRSFEEAIKLLRDYYGNDQAHIRDLHIKLANLKPCQNLKDTKIFAFELERLARELKNANENIEGPAIYLALEKKLNKQFLREILVKKAEEGSTWSTSKFRESLHNALQRELAINEVLVDNEHEKGHAQRVSRPSPRNVPFNGKGHQYTYAAINEPVNPNKVYERIPQTFGQNLKREPRCVFCTGTHWSDQCQNYKYANERIQFVRTKNLCMGCLSNKHTRPQCQKLVTCFHCKGTHPSALCFKKFGQKQNNNFNTNKSNNYNKDKFQNKPDKRVSFNLKPPSISNGKGTGANNVPLGTNKNLPPFDNGGFNSKEYKNFKNMTESPNRELPQQVNCQMIEPLNNEGLGKALLMTVEIEIFNPRNEDLKLKALAFLDPGSQRSFITKSMAEKLKLINMGTEEYYLTSFGNATPKQYKCDLVKIGIGNGVQKLTMVVNKLDFLVNPLPYYNMNELYNNLDKLYAEKLITTKWNYPDLLLGMDIWNELRVQRIQVLPSGFTVSQSRLGPILSGWGQIEEESQQLPTGVYTAQTTHIYSAIEFISNERPKMNKENDEENQENLATLFGLSGVGMEDLSPRVKDEEVLEHFQRNLTFVEGRYEVALPFNENIKFLPTNFHHAKVRLVGTIKKLQKLGLIDEYEKIINEQLEKGMIEKVDNPKESQGPVHYLPHRAVLRLDKAFTKVRIVMDASAKPPGQPNMPSLNNCLYTGPLLLKQLVGILLRFRLLNKVLLADIEKAFLQLGVRVMDRDCTRFLWLENPKEINPDKIIYTKCIVYRFRRVSFGLTSSPFLLNATIQEHLKLFETRLARSIEENLYMDNIMIPLKDEDKIDIVCQEAKILFSKAGMRLREFFGAAKKEFGDIPEEDLAPNLSETKIFGIKWLFEEELLVIEFPRIHDFQTKREILSVIAKVYDPLGVVSPALIPAKLLMQKIVEDNYKWDDKINEEHYNNLLVLFQTWQKDGAPIKITFPRKFWLNPTEEEEREYHCFTDASQFGFGCAVYMRSKTRQVYKTNLIFAKSLLKPARLSSTEATIPRLELQALVVGVKVLSFIQKELGFETSQATIWTDSSCNIDRLNKYEKYDRFTANRIVQIRGKFLINHIAGKENPADLCSRGIKPLDLQNNYLWWNGPTFLSREKEFWVSPKLKYIPGSEIIKEEKIEAIIEREPSKPSIIRTKRFSNYWRLVRALAYAFKFLSKIGLKIKWIGILSNYSTNNNNINNNKNNLSSEELKFSINYLILKAQEKFPPKEEIIKQLNIIKIQNLLACQGRLREADIPNEAITPIYLPKEAWLTKLIILNIHKENNHCGTQLLLGILRMRYWLPQGRRVVRETLKSTHYGCLICRKFNLQSYANKRFDLLPKERVNMARPFSMVGVDYFGPLNIKIQNQQNKVYGALFTCMVIRAIHLEMSYDLSGTSFLQAYRKFIARRGIPAVIYSDNATNFQYGAKMIKKLSKETWCTQEVQDWVAHKGTQWRFTTPRNPREGGIWERMVKVVKDSLRRSIGRQLLDHAELGTLFIELEAMANSRPLTYQSDAEPVRSLRPIDFLLQSSPEINFANLGDESDFEEELNREEGLKIIRKINERLNKLWEIWRVQYLLSLRERSEYKGKGSGKEPLIGTVVIVEDDLPRPLWRLGRIIELNKGRDGLIRTVKLNINGKIFKRSINQIYELEFSESRPKQQINKQQVKDTNIEIEMSSSDSEVDTPFPAYARKGSVSRKEPTTVMSAMIVSSLPSTQVSNEKAIENEIQIIETAPKEQSLNNEENKNKEGKNNEIINKQKKASDNWLSKYKIPKKPIQKYGRGFRKFPQPGVVMVNKYLGAGKITEEERQRLIKINKVAALRNFQQKKQEEALRRNQTYYELHKHEKCPRVEKTNIAIRAARREQQIIYLQQEETWPAPKIEVEPWAYNIFTPCEGPQHEKCNLTKTASRTAHSRPIPISVAFPLMTTLAHMLIFNWLGRQRFGTLEIWNAVREQLCAPNESILWKILKFWQHIRYNPKKAFKDKFLADIVAIRVANCKVLRNLYGYHWSGKIILEEARQTPDLGLNNWLKYITKMLSKVLTKKKFMMCRGPSKLYLIDSPFIIASDASVQSIHGWEGCKLVYFDGGRDLHRIIYFGYRTEELLIVVKPDETIMNSIANSLEFWRANGIPIGITLIHNEDKLAKERLKFTEQFRNLAESFNTGYYYFDGSMENLNKVKGNILHTPSINYEVESTSRQFLPSLKQINQVPEPPRLSLESRLKILIQRLYEENHPLKPSTSHMPTRKSGGSFIKNLGAIALICLIILSLIGSSAALVTKSKVNTPGGKKLVYRVSASPYLTQAFKEQNAEQERFRRKNLESEIKGDPVFWCATQSSALWKFPHRDEASFCKKGFRKWKPFVLETFSQTMRPQPVEAFICSAKYTREVYYLNLLGDKFIELEQKLLPLTKDECLKMTESKICPHNKKKMEKKDGLWKTEEALKVDFPGRFSSLFGGARESSVVNCHLQPTTVHYNPQTLKMFSPLYSVEKCHYMTDFCNLPDNSSIIWESHCESRNCKSCNYEYLGRWEGDYSRSGNTRVIWISSSKEVALSFLKEAPREIACNGKAIRKSEQGFAIEEREFTKLFIDRSKRSVDEEQLAAELTAAELALKNFYDKLLEEKCHQQTVRHDNPTYHVRQAFHKKDLVATWLNEDTAQVFSCVAIEVTNIRFRPVSSCFKYIPVEITLSNMTRLGFLDPELRILSESSIPADCERYRLRFLEIGADQWVRIDTSTGVWEKMEQAKIHIFHDNVTTPDMNVAPIVFHEWVMRNRTDEPIFVHVNELSEYEKWKENVKSEESNRAVALGALPGGLRQVAMDYIWNKWLLIVEWWKILSCLYSTFLFFRDIGIPLLTVYFLYPVWTTILAFMGRAPPANTRATYQRTPQGEEVELASIAPRRRRIEYFSRQGSIDTIRTQGSMRQGRKLISPSVART